MVDACWRRKEFVTISPTMVEVTDFNNTYQDSRILNVSVLISGSDRKCTVDIHSTDVVDRRILDNARGKRLVWRRSTLQCKSRRFFCRVLLHHLQWWLGFPVFLVVVTSETSIHASRGDKVNSTLRKLFNGLDNRLTTGGQVWLYPRRGRQREHKGGNSHPNNKNLDARRSRTTSSRQPLQTIWFTGQNAFGQRTSICCYGL